MTMAGAGPSCLNWAIKGGLSGIVLSWVISPVLSGILAGLGYWLSKKYIIKSKNPKDRAIFLLPIFYGISTFGLFMMIFLKSKAVKKRLTLEMKLIISAIVAVCVIVGVKIFLNPYIERTLPSALGESEEYLRKYSITKSPGQSPYKAPSEGPPCVQALGVELSNLNDVIMDKQLALEPAAGTPKKQVVEWSPSKSGDSVKEVAIVVKETAEEKPEEKVTIVDADNAEQLDAIFVFRFLLLFNACLESFAHGSNDTANATGPFAAVYQSYSSGLGDCDNDEGTVWIMAIAGLFVAFGVATFGYRVIRTIGENITVIDYHKGFYIELGSTFATMVATILEFPVSTTHCQVGGVLGVGIITSMQGTGKVAWPLFMKIFLTWVLTLPIAGGCAAIVVMVVKGSLINPLAMDNGMC